MFIQLNVSRQENPTMYQLLPVNVGEEVIWLPLFAYRQITFGNVNHRAGFGGFVTAFAEFVSNIFTKLELFNQNSWVP